MRSKTGVTSSSSDAEASFFSSAISALEVDPLGNAWHGLAWSSRYLCFDDELLNSLTALAAQLSLGETTEDRQKFFGAVEKAAEISATQPCENLANAVTDTLARYAPQFASARDSELGYLLLMICSGAIIDATKWREWIEKRMADYAFLIAKGEPCSQLLQSLNHLQKLIPISDRCFGRAKKFASGGI